MREKKANAHQERAHALYVPADFYLLRAPLLPASVYRSLSATSDRASQGQEGALEASCSQRLRELLEQPQIHLALAVASPSLWESVERLLLGKASPAQAKRIYRGVLRYLIRMSTRPTPFGLFAGVALGIFAEQTSVQLAVPPVASLRTRPDMAWLLRVIQDIEAQRALVCQLRVRTNQRAYIAGGRLLLPRADIYGQQDTRAISLRATPAVRKTLQLAQHGLPFPELAAALQSLYPRIASQQIEHLLWQLCEHHFLLSELHPPLTEVQPARYLAEQLASLPDLDAVKTALEEVLAQSAEIDKAGVSAPPPLLQKLGMSQAQLVADEESRPHIQIDTALRLKAAACNQQIAEAAADAAEILLRLSPLPQGLSHIRDYQTYFLERYGERAEVPLLDVLSPENGLDAPAGYTQPSRDYPLPTRASSPDTDPWERRLQALVAQAINQRSSEVELTDNLLAQLERWSPHPNQAPHSLEIYLQVQATSRAALDRGEWCAVVGPNCGSPMAGRTFGRFFDLLEEPGKAYLRQLMRHEEALQPDVIFAELSYQPQRAHVTNVAYHPPLRLYEIVVGTTPSVPPERVIALSDLVVGTRGGRFYLRSLRLGKQVIVTQSHMLNTIKAPNVCRFLIEVSRANQPILSSFHWGNVGASPFLPRLVRKIGAAATLVLSPARWTVSAEMLEPQAADDRRTTTWFQRLQVWREQWRVPRYVYLTEADNRLLLDLEHPIMAEELQSALSKRGKENGVLLQEVLPDFKHLWLRDEHNHAYFSEIVVPLLRSSAPSESDVPGGKNLLQDSPAPRLVSREERTFLPGDAWSYIKLYAASSQHDALIAGPVRDLIERLREQDLIDRWFFLRYCDPQPHLRLRVHAKDRENVQPLWQIVLQWSHELHKQGLLQRTSIESYEREVERYGGPMAIDLLEEVFSLDSEMTSALIAAHLTRQLTLDPLEVAVFSLDAFFAAWGYDSAARLRWLESRTQKYAWSAEFRPLRKRYCELLAPWAPRPDPELTGQRGLLLTLLEPHKAPLGDLGKQVRDLARAGELWVGEEELLASLAHMHKIRLLDLNRQREEQLYAFWKHTLQSIQLRPATRSHNCSTE